MDIKNWYVAYTLPRTEKQTQRMLDKLGFVSFLPLHKEIRTWSDRKKQIELPLFPGYIFVYTSLRERYKSLQVKGIVNYVSFDGKPATVPESVIDSLRTVLNLNVEITNDRCNLPETDVRVTITEGPFAGIEGILIKKNGKSRLVLQIESLNREVSVEVAANMVVPHEMDHQYDNLLKC
jgi:transcription antitermination factor NusG